MTLIVTGSRANRARRGKIQEMLRQICWQVAVDADTGEVSLAKSVDTTGSFTSGCECLRELVESSKTVEIIIQGPKYRLPTNPPMTLEECGGGATIGEQGKGSQGSDGQPGEPSHAKVWIDPSDLSGLGYLHQTPVWLILAHELTTGHANMLIKGMHPVADAGERAARVSENRHRDEHDMERRDIT
jgi:hypothetical protein